MVQIRSNKESLAPDVFWETLVVASLAVIALVVWGERVDLYRGYLFNDAGHLVSSYSRQLSVDVSQYLPWSEAHRPFGRDCITILLRCFGETT